MLLTLLTGYFQQEQADLEGQEGRKEEDVRLPQPEFSLFPY